jgi:hypothetical protein
LRGRTISTNGDSISAIRNDAPPVFYFWEGLRSLGRGALQLGRTLATVVCTALVLSGGWTLSAKSTLAQGAAEPAGSSTGTCEDNRYTGPTPSGLSALAALVEVEANDVTVRASGADLLRRGLRAIANCDAAGAATIQAELKSMVVELRLTFSVVVVARPGELSGIFRVPAAMPEVRNYYLVVEAVAPNGAVLQRSITSEEDGETRLTAIWAVRVPESVYNAVRDDKLDDGVIQNNDIGRKARGELAITWSVETLGGAILDW